MSISNKALRLNINEPEQIKILSTYLQDTIIRVHDMAFLQQKNRFAVVGNRFCWEIGKKNYRILCGFHFNGVQKISYRGIDRSDPNQFIHLLAVCFNAAEPPAGTISLIFAKESEIQLKVEAIQAYLHDMGVGWNTRMRPTHPENI